MHAKSNKKFSEKLQKYLTQKKHAPHDVIYYRDNISMMERGKRDAAANNHLIANFMFDRKREWEDAKTATFDFSSERSSEEDTCTICTSSFSFCNQSYITDK
jgi:hypothetical protein